MTTVRWIERLWNAKKFDRLIGELLQNRPEALVLSEGAFAGHSKLTAAALGVIRLDELSQSFVPLSRAMLRVILTAQDSGGGWGDLVVSALCTRALLCAEGNGVAIERAMASFTVLQKPEGIWPAEPIRRMPADPLQSALLLLQLGGNAVFRASVRVSAAIQWFERNAESIDAETRMIWSHARLRCRGQTAPNAAALWS